MAAIVEVGGHLTWLDITNRDTYIGDPELFGKLYVAARAYSARARPAGSVGGIYDRRSLDKGQYLYGRRCGPLFYLHAGRRLMAHEAKPHLAGASLILLAVLAADHFVETKKSQWAWAAGGLCGAAAGMVLWAAAGWIILPVMAVLARRRDAAWPV